MRIPGANPVPVTGARVDRAGHNGQCSGGMGNTFRKTRIGLFMQSPMLGGAETLLRDLVWGIDRKRFDITFFYKPWGEFDHFLRLDELEDVTLAPINLVDPLGPAVVNLPGVPATSSKRWMRRARALHKKLPGRRAISAVASLGLRYSLWSPNRRRVLGSLQEQQLDVLHIVNGGYPGAASAQAAALVSKKIGVRACLMTVCSTTGPRPFPAPAEALIDGAVRRAVDRFIVPGETVGQALVTHRGIEPASLHTIRFGISAPDPFSFSRQSIEETRARFGARADETVIGMVASFAPVKAQRHLVDAAARLRDSGQSFRLVFVGDGPLRADTEQRVRDNGLKSWTTFTNFYPDVYEAMRAFDVSVLCSEIEGLPYVVLEAMSQAKPIVATNVGGVREAVIDGETGFLVAPRSPEALAAALRCVLADRERAVAMGLAGNERYRNHFTLTTMLREHEELYLTMAERRG